MLTAGWHDDAMAGSEKMNDDEGESHVVDDCWYTDNSVSVGVGKWLYTG